MDDVAESGVRYGLQCCAWRDFIVKMTERGYNKFRRQICSNQGIDIDECNAEIAEMFGAG